MQKKNDKFLGIVKKNYNNQLEAVLEKKYFDEDVKSILLSILYKIEKFKYSGVFYGTTGNQ